MGDDDWPVETERRYEVPPPPLPPPYDPDSPYEGEPSYEAAPSYESESPAETEPPYETEPAPVAGEEPEAAVAVDVFYQSLAPYGEWFSYAPYGTCWRPNIIVVGPQWQPYSNGHWVFSEYGWTWVSDYEWGWAPFHYGRWFHDSHYGWIWIPGTIWGPAWVTWSECDGYVGWAPLPPPRVSFGVGFEIGIDAFVFVRAPHFLDIHLRHYRCDRHERMAVYRHARHCDAPSVAHVRDLTRADVRRVRAADVIRHRPAHTGRTAWPGDSRAHEGRREARGVERNEADRTRPRDPATGNDAGRRQPSRGHDPAAASPPASRTPAARPAPDRRPATVVPRPAPARQPTAFAPRPAPARQPTTFAPRSSPARQPAFEPRRQRPPGPWAPSSQGRGNRIERDRGHDGGQGRAKGRG